MRDKDFTFLFAFVKRAGMYTASGEEYGYKGVGAFLYAYEAGSDGLCDFKSHLIKKIFDKYGAPPNNGGIENQLKEAATKFGKEWHKMFQETANETLVDLSDKEGKNRFVKLIRQQLIINLKNIGNSIDPSWITNWHHIIDQIEEWKGVNLSQVEKTKFASLMEKLKSISKMANSNSPVEITTEIKLEIEELINLVQLNSDR